MNVKRMTMKSLLKKSGIIMALTMILGLESALEGKANAGGCSCGKKKLNQEQNPE
jgi:hypothetical protein